MIALGKCLQAFLLVALGSAVSFPAIKLRKFNSKYPHVLLESSRELYGTHFEPMALGAYTCQGSLEMRL